MKKEKFNVKNSIYLTVSMESIIQQIADENGCNYQKTIRYLVNKGIEQYNTNRG